MTGMAEDAAVAVAGGHPCPGPGHPPSAPLIPGDMLACSRHWYQVPRAVRSTVWWAWQGGAGAGSTEHLAAMRAAVAHMTPLPAAKAEREAAATATRACPTCRQPAGRRCWSVGANAGRPLAHPHPARPRRVRVG